MEADDVPAALRTLRSSSFWTNQNEEGKNDSVFTTGYGHLKQKRWGKEEDKEVFALLNRLLLKHSLSQDDFLYQVCLSATILIGWVAQN